VTAAENESPGQSTTEAPDNNSPATPEPSTPMVDAPGKPRPAPREPSVTHYRKKGADDGS
jgi:hypothetical protein